MSVPELVNALCHHLAARNDQPNTNFPSTKKVLRETLYKRYRDVAFTELLGFGKATAGRRGAGWSGVDSERPADGRSSSQELDGLREMLIASNAGGATRVQARGSVVVAETDGGFVFTCSEGARVYRFLELLATRWPEDDGEEDLRARRDAWSAHVGRGIRVDDPPNARFVPGLVGLRDVVGCAEVTWLGIDGASEGQDDRRIIPVARGWFDDTRGGNPYGSPRRIRDATPNADQEYTPTTTPRTEQLAQAKPFAYQPSRSPVKVPIGSLFMDRSPGKMTAFDPSGPYDDREEFSGKLRQRNKTRVDVLNQLEATTQATTFDASMFDRDTLSVVGRDLSPRIHKETVTLWNGEESEIAREALLALGGVRSSLSKLRGRLLMPQALPRPASAHILCSMVEASSARYLVEDFVMPIVKERNQLARDPVSHAFAHGLKHVLEGVDKELVKVEMQDMTSWMQPVGLKVRAGVDASGAEYHGMGMSILQLAHATDKSRTSLLFLASYFDDGEDAVENYDGDTLGVPGVRNNPGKGAARDAHRPFPRGRALMEFLYASAQSCAEGPCADIANGLFMRSFAPYLLHVCRWAFGIECLTEADTFAAPLSSEFTLNALGGTLGPGHIPSFFSARIRRDLMVAGTQLRLLYAWKHGAMTHGINMETEVSSFLTDAMRSIDDEGNMQGQRDEGTEPALGRMWAPPGSGSRWFTSGPPPWQTSDSDFDPSNTVPSHDCDGSSLASLAPSPSSPAPGTAVSTRRAFFQQMLDNESKIGSMSVLLERHIGVLLRKQAALVSRACVRLFVDRQQLDSLSVIRFLRDALMGFAGDFSSELVHALDVSIMGLESMTAPKARAAVFAASSNSCLHRNPLTQHLTASLLPYGENAISLVEDAFSYSTEYSDAIRIKAPYVSSMAPMLVPPVGHAAYDCINVSFVAPGLLGAIISDDTMTAYSAIFSMNLRLRRALLALDTINRATMMGRHERMKCARGDFRMPWAERFKTFRAFCLSCSVHLDGVAHMYRACCSGTAWQALEHSVSAAQCAETTDMDAWAEAEDIHTLIKVHRRFVYCAAGRITSACDSPAIKVGLESMLDAVLELRDTIERAARSVDGGAAGRGHAEPIFEDPVHWQNIKRLMLVYERGRLGALNSKGRRESRALHERESFSNELMIALDSYP